MQSLAARASVLFVCLAAFPSVAVPEGLSREQGDAILSELRQIRSLLERGPRRPGLMQQVPGPQVPATGEKVVLRLDGDRSLGRSDAPVTIVEYTDYGCPACAAFQAETFPLIKKNFIETGKVRFIKRDLPADAHPDALKAAQAGRCAGDQGKFWEMHDLLSADPFAPGPEVYDRYARELSLDTRAFEACVGGDSHLAEIRASGQGAAAIGIRSTPSFVIGTARGEILDGIGITGAQPYAVFEKAITDFLTGKPAEKSGN